MQTLDRKDATRDANSRRFLNKCQARSLLLFNGCILNLATRVNPVGRARLRSDFGAIGILKVEIPVDRVTRPKVAFSSRLRSAWLHRT